MTPPPTINGFNIVWSDAFLGPAHTLPDSNNNWNIIQTGPNSGNNEVQTYTNSVHNVQLSGGSTLQIMPQKDGNGNWTSGRIEGIHKFSCQAGQKMILQANLRTGRSPVFQQAGIWPAFWALGDDIRSQGVPWPQCGEWDIMENAHGEGSTLASLHYGTGAGAANARSVGGGGNSAAWKSIVVENFNTYSLTVDRTPSNWQDESLTWSLNGTPWFTARGADVGDIVLWGNCAHKAFYALLNVAVGSNFPGGGQPDGATTTGTGSGMEVTYVAFYKSGGGGGGRKEL